MKKFGFTLAEVLVTLGIIGVVSALVLPTFTASTQRAKVGPKLAKAVSVFEQATQAVLNDAESDSISGAQVECRAGTLSPLTGCFYQQLEHHLKGAANGNNGFTSSDGVTYSGALGSITEGEFAHETVALNRLTININPNTQASVGGNVFYFHLMDDGTMMPWGSSREDSNENVWTRRCPRGDRVISGADRDYCAGHVMENGLKVEYKL